MSACRESILAGNLIFDKTGIAWPLVFLLAIHNASFISDKLANRQEINEGADAPAGKNLLFLKRSIRINSGVNGCSKNDPVAFDQRIEADLSGLTRQFNPFQLPQPLPIRQDIGQSSLPSGKRPRTVPYSGCPSSP